MILKNTTNSNIDLIQIGITILANNQYGVQSGDRVILYEDDSQTELQGYINSGDIIVNDGTRDLSITEALTYIKFPDQAISLLFDNSSNGFTSQDVQSAIEEAKNPPETVVGWESVQDTTYTENSPLTINPNSMQQIIINRDFVINSELPNGVTQFWNDTTNTFDPVKDGDFYVVRLGFTIKPQQNNRVLDFSLDIGGSIGVIYEDFKSLVKGAGTPTIVSEVIPVFTGSTFVTNGGSFFIKCNTRLEVYNLSILIMKNYDGDEN
jgi:hypothetical protein